MVIEMETIKIIIFSNDKELAERYMCSINTEMKYFQEQLTVITINDIEELKKVNDIKLLIYIINDKKENVLKEDLKNKSDTVIVVDKVRGTIQNEGIVFSIKKYQDDRAIAFNIVWEYLNNGKTKM